MYRPQSGHMSRPPSPRPTHVPLSIRTTIVPSQTLPHQQGQASYPPQPLQPLQQPYPKYPLKIPPERFPMALEKYSKYCLEKGLAQRVREPQSAIEPNNPLSIPNVRRAHSVSTPGSSRLYAPSVSDSLHDGVTESVVSFPRDESVGSVDPKGTMELINHNGKPVRQHTRRRLRPLAKAKADLIRYLKSCWVCRSRRVECPLYHHDIESLEAARLEKLRNRAQSVQETSRLNKARPSSAPSGSILADVSNDGGSQRRMASLMGVGGGVGQPDRSDQYDQYRPIRDMSPANTAHIDSQPSTHVPEPDLLSEIAVHRDVADPSNLAPPMPTLPYADPSLTSPDGRMIPTGGLHNFYYSCGMCNHSFADTEPVEVHFETRFPHNPNAPADHLVCFICSALSNYPTGLCKICGSESTIKTRIDGNVIRVPTEQRYGLGGQDFLEDDCSVPNFPDLGIFGMVDNDFRSGGVDGADGNCVTGHDEFYNFQNDFEDPSSQGSNGWR